MNKKNGFTLIELLGVIIIIAIIAIISTPSIIGIINDVNNSAFTRSIEGISRAVALHVNVSGIEKEYIFPDANEEIAYKGKKILGGSMKMTTSGEIIINGITDGKYCAFGIPSDLTVKSIDDCTEIDTTNPIVEARIGEVTSSTIKIITSALDEESGIEGYYYSTDDGNTWTDRETINTYTLTNLTKNTEYKIKVKVKNMAGLITVQELIATTTEITAPLLSGDPTDWTNDFVDVLINYPEEKETDWIYEYKKDSGNWSTLIDEVFTKVRLTENGIVIARITDNSNTVTGIAYNVDNIDKTKPNINSVTGNPTDWTPSDVTLIINAIDHDSGIEKYSFDNGVSWQSSNQKVFTTNQTVNIQVRDNAGNISDTVTIEINKIDKDNPTTVSLTNGTITSSSIALIASGYSPSGITGYYFSKDNGNTWTPKQETNTYTFTNLTKNTNYNFKVKVENSLGAITTSDTLTKTTSNILAPTLSGNPTDWTNDKVEVTINYPSTKESNWNYEYKKDSGSWQTLPTGSTIKVTFTANGTLIARITDGTNTVEGITYNINKIDKIAPIVGTITSSSTYNSVTLTLNEATDENSGIKSYCYKKTTDGEYICQSESTYTFSELSSVANYEFNVYVIDNANNISTTSTIPVSTGSAGPCITEDTEIAIGLNGETALAKDVKEGDEILTFNSLTGEFELNKVLFVNKTEVEKTTYTKLKFSDGSSLGIFEVHKLFNVERNYYKNINTNYVHEHVGQSYYKINFVENDINIDTTMLYDYEVISYNGYVYDFITENNTNYFANGFITSTLAGFSEPFEFSTEKPLTYNMDSYLSDIETYGLITYEEFKAIFGDFLPEYYFNAMRLERVMIGVLKGYITDDDIADGVKLFS